MFRVVISVEGGVLLKKVVYFDENSATDYLVVKNGGALVLNDFEEEKSGSSAEIHVGAKLKLLFNSLFVSGAAKVDSNIGLYTSGENLIKTTITNTTLSDFYELLNDDNEEIAVLRGYSVEIVPNSIAAFQTVTPYLVMAEGKLQVDEDMAISINKMYDTLKLGKGYYELLAKNGEELCILRFNHSSFKNNYGISDLIMMDLAFAGMKVGTGSLKQLDFLSSFGGETNSKTFTEISEMTKNADGSEDKQLPIYDIVLAGVE